MNRKKVKYIFIVVVYRNVEDIIELLESIEKKVSSYQVVIVNNFYDNSTKCRFEEIASEYACDFINCPNRGYGAGNNQGIRFAIERYDFDFLVISNPDIVIKNFAQEMMSLYKDGVIGCTIYNLNGKNQNPMLVRNNKLATKLLYRGLKSKSKLCMFLGKALNKIERNVAQIYMRKIKPKSRKIYQIHGSFLIFSYSVIKKVGALYDEEMFLFGEEGYLAYLLNKQNIPTYYCPEMVVLHKEDGSMKFRDDINEECVKASLYFFEKYYFGQGD